MTPPLESAAPPKLQFAKIKPIDGCRHGWAIVEMRDVRAMTEGGAYEIQHVWMTRAEFEGLKEFEGW